jgi:hypothetical protein
MEDDHKYFYTKFKMDSKLKIVDNLFISEDRATIDEWKGSRARKDDREWPVFENLRSDPHFVETFEREFGQRMVADLEASTASKSEPEEPSEATSATPSTNSIH